MGSPYGAKFLDMATHGEKLQTALGKQIRAERTALGLTQAELAASIGKNEQTVARYEKGQREVSVAQLADLAAAFGIGYLELLDRAEKRVKQINGTDS